jgi:UDP-N-acetyl-D-glucosamine dehydrogenase
MKNFSSFSKLKKKILQKNSNVAVIGLGYVGLPLAVSFAISGFKVFGLDNDSKKISKLQKGENVISSIENSFLKKAQRSNLICSKDFNLLSKSDVIIICVPTPIYIKKKTPMMEHIKEVIDQMGKYSLQDKLIILECTTYPGTTEEYLLPLFNKQKLIVGKNVFLGYSPEREDPGNKFYSVLKKNIPKIVSGMTNKCLGLTNKIYSYISKKTYKVSNIKTAEFTKLLENIYRSVNIGLVNEMKTISDKFEIDIYETIKAAKTKPFGYQAFYPGPGVGGHCIPVDPYFLTWKAKQYGIDTRFIKLAGEINEGRPMQIINYLLKYFDGTKLSNLKCLVLGLAYKKNSDDVRMSPAIKILRGIKKNITKNIYVYDPNVPKKNIIFSSYNHINVKKISKKKLNKIDFILILVNHDGINYKFIEKNSKIIFDTRNSFNFKKNNIIQI